MESLDLPVDVHSLQSSLPSVAKSFTYQQELYVMGIVVRSPTEFWVQCLDQVGKLQDLMTRLNQHYGDMPDGGEGYM